MNIVFFGSAQFAVPSLKAILGSGHKVSCVVTQPDRVKGRGLHPASTAVKNIAREANLKVYQPERINTPEVAKFLKDLAPDLFVVIAYGQILSQEILDIPEIFAINLHASLLPQYRGAAPINWAIINKEKKTGVTVIKMERIMDAGAILLQKALDIGEQDTALTLEEKLAHLGREVLLESIKSIQDKDYRLIEQAKDKVSFAPKLKKQDGRIDWESSAIRINNLIRGCVSWPGAYTYYKGKLLKIYQAKALPFGRESGVSCGQVIEVSKENIIVVTGEGALSIEKLQVEGKKIMEAKEFISGYKISAADKLG
jgi:methionyl-tRNA formyltransferase